jgi:hypothetical protein
MSWINIGDCRFRKPLPNTLKDRTVQGTTSESKQRRFVGNDVILTKHIIPTELCWTEKSVSDSEESSDIRVQGTILELDGSEFWIWRETSCDI